MSCSPFDLRDYFLQELPDPQQHQVEAHVKTCLNCREELDRLQFTETALQALGDEEIPQRIAFVSDKIFEPSAWRRWWTAFWGSGARLGFASAAMLSIALVVSALTRPAPAPVLQVTAPPAAAAVSDTEIARRVETAVETAVAASEARQAVKVRQLVSEMEASRQRLKIAAAEFDYYQKQANLNTVMANNYAMKPADNGEPK